MKCPKCEYNQPYKDGIICKSCGYQFILNPKTDEIADYKMMKTVERASGNGQYYFTTNQVYGAYLSKIRGAGWDIYLFLGLVIGGVAFVIGSFIHLFFGLFLMGLISYGLFRAKKSDFFVHRTKQKDFLPLVDKWLKVHKNDKLLTKPRLENHKPPKNYKDTFDYGVEGLIITSEDLYVDMLVWNDYHKEFKVLVVSVNGYPSYLAELAGEVLQRTPELPVFLMHDATTEIASHPEEEAGRKYPIQGHPIIDLGLNADDIHNAPAFKQYRHLKNNSLIPFDILHYNRLRKASVRSIMHQLPLTATILVAGGGFLGRGGGGGGGDFDGGDFG